MAEPEVERLADTLSFAVFGLGRCGTTWATAWLSGYAHVLHDPILTRSVTEMADWAYSRGELPRGIVCTASWLVPGLVDALLERGKPVVGLRRNADETDASYRRIGLGGLPDVAVRRWDTIGIDTTPWTDLFDKDGAQAILARLMPWATFDPIHHEEMTRMHIEPAQHVIDAIKRAKAHMEAKR